MRADRALGCLRESEKDGTMRAVKSKQVAREKKC